MPDGGATYRESVERQTKYRMGVVEKEEDIRAIENEINDGKNFVHKLKNRSYSITT